MSESNPFAFTGLNLPQLSSSEAGLRAELARSKQTVAVLQREVREANDVNGVAQALATAKNQVQEAQRESKRAQIAERVARAALANFNNTRKQQTEEHNMSEDSMVNEEQVKDLKKRLAESESEIGDLRAELEDCQGSLDNAREQLQTSITSEDYENILERHETRHQSALEDAEKARSAIADLQKDLRTVNDRLTFAEADLKKSASIANAFRTENVQLDKALNEQQKENTHLKDINDKLVADLNENKAQRKALSLDRDQYEEKFMETWLALEESQRSETQVRGEFEQFKDEVERTAHEMSADNEKLQDEYNTVREQVDGHAHDMAVKDARIAFLEQEKEALERKLKEEQAHDPVNVITVRPPTYRSFSTGSTLADELNNQSTAGFESDEDDFSDRLSASEELAEMSVDLGQSLVQELFSVTPGNHPTPNLTLSILDTVSTTPQQRRDSFPIDFSPVTSVSSAEPSQFVMPALSEYVGETLQTSPVVPVTPALVLSEMTAQSVSPSEARTATPNLSLHVLHQASFGVEPRSGDIHITSSTNNLDWDFYTGDEWAEKQRKATRGTDNSQQGAAPPYEDIPESSERNDSVVGPDTSTSRQGWRRPLDMFSGLRKQSDNNVLNEVLTQWPVQDGIEEEPSSTANSPPSTPHTGHTIAPNKETSPLVQTLGWYLSIVLGLYCFYLYKRLSAWEFANGNGFDEGYGNFNDRYSPYGNGHLLLGYLYGMLPSKWVSADSPFPTRAVDIFTHTASVFEGLMGLSPTPLF